MIEMDTEEKIAKALISINAVGFVSDNPITFKSGIVSPVYVDNRKFPFYPEEWREIIIGFADIIKSKNLEFDIIAGVEAAGIPHSAGLGFYLGKPSVFVRKQAKDHGTKKMVEGGDVTGKKVLLIEDLVTTGGSSLRGVEALRTEGAIVEDCLVIASYDFKEARDAFIQAKINLYTLTTFPKILEEALREGKIKDEESKIIKEWFEKHRG
jgi:orotate phosphoribosyltransferase